MCMECTKVHCDMNWNNKNKAMYIKVYMYLYLHHRSGCTLFF